MGDQCDKTQVTEGRDKGRALSDERARTRTWQDPEETDTGCSPLQWPSTDGSYSVWSRLPCSLVPHCGTGAAKAIRERLEGDVTA